MKWSKNWWSLSPRFEVFTDRSGVSVDTGTTDKPALPQILKSATLTFAADCGEGLELRLEARRDESSASSFTNASGDPGRDQSTLTLGMLYDF